MNAVSTRRLIGAVVASAAAAMLALWVSFIVLLVFFSPDIQGITVGEFVSSGSFWLFMFVVVGFPVAALLTAAIGIPGYRLLSRRGLFRPAYVLAVATAVGAAVMPLVTPHILAISPVWPLVIAGAIMGFAAGATFAVILRADKSQATA